MTNTEARFFLVIGHWSLFGHSSLVFGDFSDRVGSGFAGSDAEALVEGGDEDFAVADFAVTVFGGFEDGVHGDLGPFFGGTGDIDADFGQEVGGDFLSAVEVGVFGASASGASADGDAEDFGADEGLADFFEFVGLNDGGDEFEGHDLVPVFLTAEAQRRREYRKQFFISSLRLCASAVKKF